MITSPSVRLPDPDRPRFRRLADWLRWQESAHVREIDLGLERVRAVAERMRLGRRFCPTISVGGTNGKGSSVAMLDAVLQAAGYRVGRYTSPHLVRYNERICIGGQLVSDEQLCEAFARVDRARRDISLTYFEFGTLAALDLFSRAGVDVAVLEVGMGGRLDAVNLIDADVALVATVDIDHVEWLGPDREAIGREKAGIFRRGQAAVCSDPAPPASLQRHAEELGARLYRLGRDYGYRAAGEGWDWWSRSRSLPGLPRPRLVGDFQLQNAAGVLMALEAVSALCPVGRAAIERGLREVSLRGRFELLPGPVTWLLDVAHNPQSARALAANLQGHACAGRTHYLVGMLRDKDIAGVFREMLPHGQTWHLATLGSRRGASAEQLAAELEAIGVAAPVATYEDVAAAFRAVCRAAEAGDRVLVFGSFLTVAEVAKLLGAAGPR